MTDSSLGQEQRPSPHAFPAPGTTYLPAGLSPEDILAFGHGDRQPLLDSIRALPEEAYERIGTDRVLAILIDLARTNSGRNVEILDVGCSIGTISVLLAASGHTVTGIDSDVVAAVQEWQSATTISETRAAYGSNCEFLRVDLRTHLAETERTYDVALLLSVVHHWLSGYGYTGVERFDREDVRHTLQDLCRRVRSHLYVEIPIEDEVEEMPVDPEGEFLFPGWFLESGLANDVRLVASTIATNGKPRRLWRVDLR